MQTKSTVAMLVHNYRAVLKKCFWANIMGRQEALKSLGSLVNKSALAGLLVAGMTGLAGQIDVNSESGAVAIHPQTSECVATQEMSDPFAQAADDEFCALTLDTTTGLPTDANYTGLSTGTASRGDPLTADIKTALNNALDPDPTGVVINYTSTGNMGTPFSAGQKSFDIKFTTGTWTTGGNDLANAGVFTANDTLSININADIKANSTWFSNGVWNTTAVSHLRDAGDLFVGDGTNATTLTYRHNGGNATLSQNLTIASNATFVDVADYKYSLTLSGALSGAGTFRAKIPTIGRQTDNYRNLTLNGNTTNFTGTLVIEASNYEGTALDGNNSYRTNVNLNSADSVFGGTIKFQGVNYNNNLSTDNNAAKPAQAKLTVQKNMSVANIVGTAGIVDLGANRLTLVTTGENTFGGVIRGTGAVNKTGTGTQTLSGANTYTGKTTISAGTLNVTGSLASIDIEVTGGTLNLSADSLSDDSVINLNGGAVTGTFGTGKLQASAATTLNNLTLNGGTIVFSDAMIFGTPLLTLGTGTLTAANIDVSSLGDIYTNLAANSSLTLIKGVTSIDNLTLITGTNVGTLSINSGDLIFTKSDLVELTWDITKDTWATGSAFSTDTNFADGNAVTFGVLTANETVTIDGTVKPLSMTINDTSDFIYTFTGGKIETVGVMTITDGQVVFDGTDLSAFTGALTGGEGTSLTLTNVGTMTTDFSTFTGALAVNGNSEISLGTGKAGITRLISGTGTVNVGLTNAYGNVINLGTGFTGTLGVTAGYFTLNTVVVGEGVTLSLAGGVNAQVTATSTIAYNLNLNGAHEIHTNGTNVGTFTGTITGTGATVNKKATGTAIFENTVTIGTFNHEAGTTTFNNAVTIGTFNHEAGTTTFAGPNESESSITTFNLKNPNSGSILNINSGTLNIGTFVGSIGNNKNGGDVKVAAGATLNITNKFTLKQEYGGTSVLTVNGTMTVGDVLEISRDGNGVVNIENGGLLTVKKLGFGQNWPGTKSSTVNLKTGGTLVVGANGIGTAYGNINTAALNLSGGTLGTSADTMTAIATIPVVLTEGTTSTINTGKYEAGEFSATGSTITMAGVITGAGAVNKTGAGNLTLSGANTYTGKTTISAGTLNVTGSLASTDIEVTGGTLNLSAASLGEDSVVNLNGGAVTGTFGSGKLQASATTTLDGLTLNGGTIVFSDAMVSGTTPFLSLGTGTLTAASIDVSSLGDVYTNLATDGSLTLMNGVASTDNLTLITGANVGMLSIVEGNLVFAKTTTSDFTWNTTDDATWKVGTNFGGTSYADAGAKVIFGNLTVDETVTIDGTVAPISITVDPGAEKVYTFESANEGKISGSATLAVNSGKMILNGDHTFTGVTTIATGATLALGGTIVSSVTNNGTLVLSKAISSSIINNGALEFANTEAMTFANTLTGTGTIKQTGTGTTTITADVTDRNISVDAGAISMTRNGSTPKAGTITVAAGAIANIGLSGVATGDKVPDIADVFEGAGTVKIVNNAGALDMQNGLKTAGKNSFSTFTGTLELATDGSNKMRLTGFALNSTKGAMTIKIGAGVQLMQSPGNANVIISGDSGSTKNISWNGEGFGAIRTGSSTFGGDWTLEDGANLLISTNAASTYTFSGNVNGANATFTAGGYYNNNISTYNFTGENVVNLGTLAVRANGVIGLGATTQTIGTISMLGNGTVNVTNDATVTNLSGTTGKIIISQDKTLSVSASTGNFAGIISGAGALTKTGAGNLTLSGANTYTGKTTISDGALRVTGSIASTAIEISKGILNLATGSLASAGTTITMTGGTLSGTLSANGTLLVNSVEEGDSAAPALSSFTLAGGKIQFGVNNAITLGDGITFTSGTIDFTGLTLGADTVVFSGGSEALATSLNTETVGLTLIGKGDGTFAWDADNSNIIYKLAAVSLELQDYFSAAGVGNTTGDKIWNTALVSADVALTIGSDVDTDKYFTDGVTFATGGAFDLTGKTYKSLTIDDEIVTIANNSALGTSTNGITIQANGTLKLTDTTAAFAQALKGTGTLEIGTTQTITGALTDFTGKVVVSENYTATTFGGATEVEVKQDKTLTYQAAFNNVTLSGAGTLLVNDDLMIADAKSGTAIALDSFTGTINTNGTGKNLTIGTNAIGFAIGEGWTTVTLTGTVSITDTTTLANNDLVIAEGATVSATGAITTGAITVNGTLSADTILGSVSGAGEYKYIGTENASVDLANFTMTGTLTNDSGTDKTLSITTANDKTLGFTVGTGWNSFEKQGEGKLTVGTLMGDTSTVTISEGTLKITEASSNAGTVAVIAGATFEIAANLSLEGNFNLENTSGVVVADNVTLTLTSSANVTGNLSNVLSGTTNGTLKLFDQTIIGGQSVADLVAADTDWISKLETFTGLTVVYDMGAFDGNFDSYYSSTTGWNIESINSAIQNLDGTSLSIGTGSRVLSQLTITKDASGVDLSGVDFVQFTIGANGKVLIDDNSAFKAGAAVINNGTLTLNTSTFGNVVTGSGVINLAQDFSITANNFDGFTGTLTSDNKKLTISNATLGATMTGFSEIEVAGAVTVGDNFTFDKKLSGAGTITNGTFSGNTDSTFSGTANNVKLNHSKAFKNATVSGDVTVSGTGTEIGTMNTGSLTLDVSSGAANTAVVTVTTLGITSANVMSTNGVVNGRFALISSGANLSAFNINVSNITLNATNDKMKGDNGYYTVTVDDAGTLWLDAATYTDNQGEVVDEYNSAPVVAGQVQQVINTAGMVNNAISEHLTQTIVNPLTINSLTSLTRVDGMQASTESGVQIITQNIESVGTNVWGQALYSYAEHDGVRKGLDSDENSYGGMIGIERVYQDFSYGAFIGGISSEVDGDNGYNVESEAIYAGLYTGVRGEVLFANAGVMFGYSFNDTERPGTLQDIEGDYDSWMTNVFGEIGAFHHFTENIYGRASVGMQYSYVKAEDYQESEGGNAVDSCNFDSLTVGVDVRLGYRFAQSYLELRAGVTTELLDTEIDSDFRIIDNPGTLYTSQGGELDENKFILGVEGGHRFNDNLEFRAGVLGEFGDSHERYTGNVRLIYSF